VRSVTGDGADTERAVEVVAGFNVHDGGTEVVVVRRTHDGTWLAADTDTPVDEATVARLAGRPAAGPVELIDWRAAVISWLNRYAAPGSPMHLTDWQTRYVGEAFADFISEGNTDRGC
jgi:hypothetical protein